MDADSSDTVMAEAQDESPVNIDPIWMSSRTSRQIYALGEVEKVCPRIEHQATVKQAMQDISRLLSLAASSISLLTLPQTDAPEDELPQGGERSEQFVLEVSEYFERLDVRLCLLLLASMSHSSSTEHSHCDPFVSRPHPSVTNSALRDQRATARICASVPRSRDAIRERRV